MDTSRPRGQFGNEAPGGTVESVPSTPAPSKRPRTPKEPAGERYELRDRTTKELHRANTFSEMAAKAEGLGSDLFVAVAADGRRTSIEKIDGQWRRGPQRPASSVSPAPLPGTRDPSPAPTQGPAPALSAPREAPQRQGAGTLGHSEAEHERAAHVARLEAALRERYTIHRAPVSVGDAMIGRIEYRFRGDGVRVAFTESRFRLATDNNLPSVARSMVDVAEARGWRGLRVSGHEEFRRRVWFEATLRGLKSVGYEPSPDDLQQLRREQDARQANRVERVQQPGGTSPPQAEASAPTPGGRKTVLAAVEAVLVAKNVPEQRREELMAAVAENLAQRIREGREPRVRIYDRDAVAPLAGATAVPAPTRAVERSDPTPQR